MPVNWTRGENNDSGINLSILAQIFEQPEPGRALAQVDIGSVVARIGCFFPHDVENDFSAVRYAVNA